MSQNKTDGRRISVFIATTQKSAKTPSSYDNRGVEGSFVYGQIHSAQSRVRLKAHRCKCIPKVFRKQHKSIWFCVSGYPMSPMSQKRGSIWPAPSRGNRFYQLLRMILTLYFLHQSMRWAGTKIHRWGWGTGCSLYSSRLPFLMCCCWHKTCQNMCIQIWFVISFQTSRQNFCRYNDQNCGPWKLISWLLLSWYNIIAKLESSPKCVSANKLWSVAEGAFRVPWPRNEIRVVSSKF